MKLALQKNDNLLPEGVSEGLRRLKLIAEEVTKSAAKEILRLSQMT
jgi:hypothetical protein